jgi:Spy/CpxP family protein refolding chaperone
MLNRLCTLLLAVGLFASYGGVSSAFAQDAQSQQPDQSTQQPNQQGGKHHHRGGKNNSQKHLQKLTKELNLSADQQAKVKSILDDQQQQFATIHQDSSLSKADKKAKMAQVHDSAASQVRAILNPDQQTKFDAMMAKHKDKMSKKGHKGSDQNAPPQQ